MQGVSGYLLSVFKTGVKPDQSPILQPFIRLDHIAIDKPHGPKTTQRLHLLFENIGNENVIRTKRAQVPAPGFLKKQAEAVVWPPILRVDDVFKPGVLVSLHDLSGVIRRGVVYYKQLKIAEILGQDRFYRFSQEAQRMDLAAPLKEANRVVWVQDFLATLNKFNESGMLRPWPGPSSAIISKRRHIRKNRKAHQWRDPLRKGIQ